MTIIDENNNPAIGTITDVLTKIDYHHHGIKVQIHTGISGRVSKFNIKSNKQFFIDEHMLRFKHDIKKEENETLEFKASLFFDLKKYENECIIEENTVNVHSIAKTIAAFANNKGGILYIGIKDKTNEIIGLENDYKLIQNGSGDRFLQRFKNKMNKLLSYTFQLCVDDYRILKTNNGDICMVKVKPLHIPVIVYDNNEYQMYVRHGNSSDRYDNIQNFCLYWHEHMTELERSHKTS